MRILTGIQPSGALHFGNYFGAVMPFLHLQKQHTDTWCMIADLHAQTSLRDGGRLNAFTLNLATELLALGIDPKQTKLFRQSAVPQHTALMWLLSTLSPLVWLQRGHSYKDKISRGQMPSAALFTYPLLMAADILLYQPDWVPVGSDQQQHLEFTRDLAEKFNHHWAQQSIDFAFVLPQGYLQAERVLLPGTDGRKMSKSYNNTIGLFAATKDVEKKIMTMQTDSTPVAAPKPKDSAVLIWLQHMYAAHQPSKLPALQQSIEAGGVGYGDYKKQLFAAIMDCLGDARRKYAQLIQQPDDVMAMLHAHEAMARAEADKVYMRVSQLCGGAF